MQIARQTDGADHITPTCIIGASAGDGAALSEFFRHLPDDLGLAYIVVIHLDFDHPGSLGKSLAGVTHMPVRQVRNAARLAPNRIYVIPPDRELLIERKRVVARPRNDGQRLPRANDPFFRSVGENEGQAGPPSNEASYRALQRVNAELRTANAELERKLEKLGAAHSELETIVAATDVNALFLDQELRIQMFTPSAGETFGIADSDVGRAVIDFTDQLDCKQLATDAEHVLRTLVPLEREVETTGGRWLTVHLRPYRNTGDRPEGVVATFADITGRRRSEARLRRSEDRFRALVNSTSEVLYRMSPDWSQLHELKSRGFLSDTSEPIENWSEKYILPEDRSYVWEAIRDAIRTRSVFELEHRVRQADGTIGWTLSRAVPILDDNGAVVEWFGAASDLTERRRREEAQQLLVHELNHRVKNMLAIVQSVARQTQRTTPDVRAFAEAFERRLQALASAHDILNRSSWEGVDLGELARQALGSFANQTARRLSIAGPRVLLRPEAVFSFAMALHELATNALKYGALSGHEGRVEVQWEIDGEHLLFQWRERGGPSVIPPKRRGFGSRLLENGMARELDGAVRIDFLQEGVRYRLELPIDAAIGAG